ncbi:MAG TPA: flippase-like domain-containing protein [Thermoanaerobaculia bacterium]|nr:flippase-like domain-containing protein [Thermoanaerobaculia bacterium]
MNRPGAPDAALERSSATDRGPVRRGRGVLRVALFLGGLVLLVAILVRVGWRPVLENLARVGPWFPALVALYALAQLSFAAGWWVLTGPRGERVPFGALFAAYLGGDSVNYFTSVGGEPVKAELVKERLGFSHAFATVAVHRHADVLAQWIFLTLGVGVALVRFDLPGIARIAALASLLVLGALVLAMTMGLRRGAFGPIVSGLARVRLLRRLARVEPAARRIDERIGAFYREKTDHFGLAIAWCLFGWCGGLVETYLVLRLLTPAADWSTAVAIESLAMVLNNILLFIPGRVGSAEGVRIAVYALVGLPPAQGTAYALVRRGRELLWLVPGFVVLLKRHVLDHGRLRIPDASTADPQPTAAESRA